MNPIQNLNSSCALGLHYFTFGDNCHTRPTLVGNKTNNYAETLSLDDNTIEGLRF